MLDKQQILERILGMFMRYGIKSMTMDDIARELGVSKKTLYQDFKDKRSLISEVVEFDLVLNKQLRDQVLLPRLSAIEEFHLINSRIHFIRSRYSETFHWDLKRYFPDTYQNWVSNRRSSVYKLITDNLKKGKKEGVYRREIKEQVIGNLYVIIIEMLESSDLLDDHESLSGDFIKEMFYYHLHGICNQSGLIELARWSSENRNTQAFKI
jgi:AcrR family transcriptional regulator